MLGSRTNRRAFIAALGGAAAWPVVAGGKPAELPVQALTKYELVLNNQTDNALGITFPPSVLARADEVIE
jgi:putative ABC transport system substrate-binding protein